MISKLTAFAGGVILSVASLSLQAGEALEEFTSRLKTLDSMSTEFSQVTMDQNGEVLQSLSGTLSVQRPGKMRWQTNPPYEQLVVSDGSSVWVYDMDLEQVTIRNLEAKLQETPALLLSGDVSNIADSYSASKEQVGDVVRYRLKPLDASQLFEALEFDYADDEVEFMRIFDAAGQITEIRFTSQETNTEFDPAAFTFAVPDDVDVIDGRHGG
ncbi:MAG: outer membrane lipoprotein chaperone LolA [Thalassolituus sp.]|mgnify:CR=1 FL=1|jgi:outer membrane lipoprotein carrier protein|uniref:outer membrane lipoprotein chaperone LolA n=1 Tax=Thalassolituus sp. TaxID=2030822 RepID=UPI0023B40539|nr:outer membrane lipoprotein chaperone LolA [Thalassolituus sp.]MDQ4424811.1 outer membrane lipoprotein chaperone LolA [Thalassolituus sp.]MDQ4426678.1 outer membrane lipoprotein chaperone LolA [Thalassolituus sp.]|tara:strand:+ start:2770 stop:3408 length:639 start_codon:yes stop_codon:yes gene_type:complete